MSVESAELNEYLEACNSEYAADRLSAVRRLAAEPREEAREVLERIARADPERMVRMAASDALSKLGARSSSVQQMHAERKPVPRVLLVVMALIALFFLRSFYMLSVGIFLMMYFLSRAGR